MSLPRRFEPYTIHSPALMPGTRLQLSRTPDDKPLSPVLARADAAVPGFFPTWHALSIESIRAPRNWHALDLWRV